MKAVQYHPDYCREAMDDLVKNGHNNWSRFDTSHDLSIIDSDGARWYVGEFTTAYEAVVAGLDVERSGVIPSHASLR